MITIHQTMTFFCMLKGWLKFCHHLLTLKLFQTVSISNEDILKTPFNRHSFDIKIVVN